MSRWPLWEKLVLFFLRMADSCKIWLAGIIRDCGRGSAIKPASKHSGCPCEIGLWGKAVFHLSKTNSLLTHFEKETILKGINPPFMKGNTYWIISHFQLPWLWVLFSYLPFQHQLCAPVDGPARAAFGWHCGVHLRHRAGALSDRKMDEAKGEQYGLYLIYTVCIIYIYICLWFYMCVFYVFCWFTVYCFITGFKGWSLHDFARSDHENKLAKMSQAQRLCQLTSHGPCASRVPVLQETMKPPSLFFQVLPHLPFGRFLWRWSTDQAWRSQCFLTRWNWSCTDQIGLKNFQKCRFQAMSVQGIHWVCPPGVLASLGRLPEPTHLQTTARIGNATLGLFIDPKFIQEFFQGQRTSQYCRHSRGILLLPVTG